jgi:hypothetical protein
MYEFASRLPIGDTVKTPGRVSAELTLSDMQPPSFKIGVLEYWSVGVLVRWSIGIFILNQKLFLYLSLLHYSTAPLLLLVFGTTNLNSL